MSTRTKLRSAITKKTTPKARIQSLAKEAAKWFKDDGVKRDADADDGIVNVDAESNGSHPGTPVEPASPAWAPTDPYPSSPCQCHLLELIGTHVHQDDIATENRGDRRITCKDRQFVLCDDPDHRADDPHYHPEPPSHSEAEKFDPATPLERCVQLFCHTDDGCNEYVVPRHLIPDDIYDIMELFDGSCEGTLARTKKTTLSHEEIKKLYGLWRVLEFSDYLDDAYEDDDSDDDREDNDGDCPRYPPKVMEWKTRGIDVTTSDWLDRVRIDNPDLERLHIIKQFHYYEF